MKGGFNKIIRNLVAGASDTEFEKVHSHYNCARKLSFLFVEINESDFPLGLEGAKRETCDL